MVKIRPISEKGAMKRMKWVWYFRSPRMERRVKRVIMAAARGIPRECKDGIRVLFGD